MSSPSRPPPSSKQQQQHQPSSSNPSHKEREGVRRVNKEKEDRIGPYVIGEEIGRGSFATVFKGWSRGDHNSQDSPSSELVAIKSVIRSKLTTKLLENLESEISILKRITHRNIVELKDCLKTDSHIYLIMAFCSAGDLSVYIKARGDVQALTASNQGLLPASVTGIDVGIGKVLYPHPKEGGLNEMIVRCFLGQLVDALRFLRAQNVIHRDIKPQNLLLKPADASDLAQGHPPGIPVLKVADFGFARWLPSQSMAETLCGSPLYMAPEILRYEKYDAKADLWSVGAVLFEMCVGKPPFRAQNHVDLLRKIERGEDKIKFPDEKRRDEGDTEKNPTRVAPDLKALIRALLKRNPIDRMGFEDFFKASDIVSNLNPAAPVSGIHSRIPSTTPRPRSVVPPPLAPRPLHPSPIADFATGPVPTTSVRPSASSSAVPIPTPASRIPSYVDQEPPPFARRTTSSIVSPSSSGPQRANSFTSKYVVGGVAQPRQASPLPIPGVVRRESGNKSGAAYSASPPTAIERFASNNKANDSMTESNDSILGRDYVVVEKRTVEINALADELANMPTRDNVITRRPSRGFLSRPPSSLGPITIVKSSGSPAGNSPIVYPYPSSNTPPFDNSATPFAITSQRQVSAPHPYSMSSSPRPLSFLSSSPRSVSNPIERFPGSPLALVGGPTAAIAKALNMASHKIFGSPSDGILLRRSSARKPITRSAPAIDPEEDRVLAELEDIAQKALVIFDFADSKIMQILPPTPQTSSSTSLGTPSYFSHVAAREQAASNPFSPVPTPSSPSMRRDSSSSGERPFVMASSVRAEILAAEAMVLYLKALAFLGKGIEKARKFWAGRGTDQAAGVDFNDAVQWFRQRFNECFDKADFSKSRCQDDIPESATFAERLIYDRALEISRAAAVNELRGENPVDIETAYETALWMLYAILDATMTENSGDLVEEEDRTTVKKFVASITNRLEALREKIGPSPS